MSDKNERRSPRGGPSYSRRQRSRERHYGYREDRPRYADKGSSYSRRTRHNSHSPDHQHERNQARRSRSDSSSPDRRHERNRDKRRRSKSRSPEQRYERHRPASQRHGHDRHERRYRSRDSNGRSRSPRPDTSSGPLSKAGADGAMLTAAGAKEPVEKQRPNFNASGKLAAESNKVSGTEIVLKYNEPPEARKPPPSQAWRLYVFKGQETLNEVDLFLRSCWLFGRERMVADYFVESPSVSKQHAVVQFRHIEKRNEYGDRIGSVKPYIIDLDSANGTMVNREKIPPSRYYELRNGDVVAFGDSAREYVFILPPKG